MSTVVAGDDDGGTRDAPEPEARGVSQHGRELCEVKPRARRLRAHRRRPLREELVCARHVALGQEQARHFAADLRARPQAIHEREREERRQRASARRAGVRQPRGGCHQDEPVDPARVPQRDVLRDHSAERDSGDVRAIDLRRVEHGGDVVGQRRHAVGPARPIAAADAAVVEDDDAPAVPGAGEALGQIEPEA
jgi:hypothetical protein